MRLKQNTCFFDTFLECSLFIGIETSLGNIFTGFRKKKVFEACIATDNLQKRRSIVLVIKILICKELNLKVNKSYAYIFFKNKNYSS